MEKDAEIRRLTAIVSTVRTALGDTENVSVMANTVPPSAVQLWRSKIGNGLAGKIFDLLASNPTREFTKQQIAFAVGASPNAGHTANEFAKLTKTKLMVRDGSLYRLNPNL